MTDKETASFMQDYNTARKAILDDLDRRHKSGDKTVQLNKSSSSEYDDDGPTNYLSGGGAIPCPVCKTGTLRYSRAAYNGHVHAGCSTQGCVQWME